MTTDPIVPDQLPAWVPAVRTVHGPDTSRDVGIPPMRDYLVVAYRRRATALSRELGGKAEPRVARSRRCLAAHRRPQLALDGGRNIEVVHEPHDPRLQPARRGHPRQIPRGQTTGTRCRS
jgi:hypothetical protein